ncbi:cytochrome c biogenesis protein ResB [bacterium]|nr:cytochrome c biogenesis protein ResB [bacterium]
MSKPIQSFVRSFAVILTLFTAGIILQNLPVSNTFKLLLILMAILPFCFVLEKVKSVLTSYQFAISLLVSILIGVISGTLVIQNPLPGQSIQAYGKLSSVIHFFFLDQLFQSWWFNLFLALMVMSLALVLIKRKPFRVTQAGFLFSHVGVILILIGGLIGRIFGTEGFIELQRQNM